MELLKKIRFADKNEIDMTEGSIGSNLFRFALPLLLGNLFQQLYNMVDTWVIGQTGHDGAYAAVGSVGYVINILIGFFTGLSAGTGVVISQYYGANKKDKVHNAVHTAMTVTLIFGALISVVGIVLTPELLKLMLHSNSDSDPIFPFAKTYLTIYFSGAVGLVIYNMGVGILRAVGDSRRPFYFLVISAVTNTVLDLLFVHKFDMGVAGVAYATVLSQCLSALLTLICLFKADSCIKLKISHLKFDVGMFVEIIKQGMPAAIQVSLTAFSNLFVQSYIGNVGNAELEKAASLGGWTSYSKLDQFIFLPLQSISLSVTTFVAQNLGKNKVERVKKGVRGAYFTATAITVALMIPAMIFSSEFAGFFSKSEPVVKNAALLIKYITPFYLFSCVNQTFSGALRGAGRGRVSMIIMLFSFVGTRQIYLYIMSNFVSNELLPIAFGYPVGWFFCCVLTLIYYFNFDMSKGCIVKAADAE